MKGKILIVDDDAAYRNVLRGFLGGDYELSEAESGAALKKAMDQDQPDVVLLDVELQDANGLEMLPSIKKRWPETEVIVLTGVPRNDTEAVAWAVAATKRGAFNFLRKTEHFDGGKLLTDVSNAFEARRRTEETSMLRRALETMSGSASPVFQSAVMREVVRTVERIAPSDVAVLITGESGTGKEVIADLIHTFSPRSKGRIIKINCAALPRELIESELFGSVKGAYTGAHADREGLFRLAEGGTLLLDEISEMPIDTQSKLLRVLQDQEVRPVGGKTAYKTNCRLVASTNRKTDEAIRDGKLREDLFYRISAISVHLPPLRERREDIMPLANAFLKRFSAQANRVIKGFTPSAAERITAFDWPGNVRQLQNEVQRSVLLSEGNEVDAADLSISTAKAGGADSSDTNFTLLEGVERNAIVQMLKETGGNKLETAKRLGIGRQTLYNKIKGYGIEV
ncbi:MAG TPA: sigma-54 dependent transcriptional regulator [Verrucomicrobiota bacterium]|jgi:DNA-binding NtrC family response regulator|nr:sigma-54 dependent transcriptional regulator [Verrucomicrobiota bacterium]HQL77589.1 sigma-54 dependent transcriptional regulator [Verrucomicrobiota bacterium]